jgi:hypothetical protein
MLLFRRQRPAVLLHCVRLEAALNGVTGDTPNPSTGLTYDTYPVEYTTGKELEPAGTVIAWSSFR